MAYYIFINNKDGIEGTLYRVSSDETHLNYIVHNTDEYKVIENLTQNFQDIILNKKTALSYTNNIITFIDMSVSFKLRVYLQQYINTLTNQIDTYIKSNPNGGMVSELTTYNTLLNSLDVNTIIPLDSQGKDIPLNSSLEEYLYNLGNNVINPLQIP